jgi:hypothetical protein
MGRHFNSARWTLNGVLYAYSPEEINKPLDSIDDMFNSGLV